jgi:hypothetical protein
MLAGLSFTSPWILAALVALPAIYYLLRVTPPAPKRIVFPPLRLLLDVTSRDETPARTPLWLLLLRLAIAALVIIALAEPIYDATPTVSHNGPLVLFVDNGWPAAGNWSARSQAMDRAIAAASRNGRSVVIVPTAEKNPETPSLMDAGTAQRTARELAPLPFAPDRAAALKRLQTLHFAERPQILWLSDGVDFGHAQTIADGLGKIGDLDIRADSADRAAIALLPPQHTAQGFDVTVERAADPSLRQGRVAALDRRGQVIGQAAFRFAAGAHSAKVTIPLQLELRNDTARLAVQGDDSAGAVQLLDSGDARQAVGLVSGGGSDSEQPLLSDVFYVERALAPYSELRKGTIEQMLDSGVSVLVLTDIGQLSATQHDAIARFVEKGGVLLRFAGPRVAAHASDVASQPSAAAEVPATQSGPGTDDLEPVKLRGGERLMGSALSWREPQHLSPFTDDSPFRGLAVPSEVTVSRQVLADPSVELAQHVWARLEDGTPLVTGAQKGAGWLVLFHVSASPGWSSLPLSGLYVDMLRRVVSLAGASHGAVAAGDAALPPLQMLDGYGRLQRPSAEAVPLKAAEAAATIPDSRHPPGYYGHEGGTVALNVARADLKLLPLAVSPSASLYDMGVSFEAKWPLLTLALLLLLADALGSLWLRGHIVLPENATAKWKMPRWAAPLLLLALLAPTNLHADDARLMESALNTKLAYVITGASDVDEMSRAGLYGLGLALKQRTAYEPTDPIGVDVEKDDLSFYPLIYWPMVASQKDLSPAAIAKLDNFMRNGGTILFDTRDGPMTGLNGTAPGQATLRRLLGKLDVPPLEPIPPDHVLTKTFYLLRDFSGRWDGGQVWVEAIPTPDPNLGPQPARGGDGVSPVIIGGNDWASAWATNSEGRPIAAVVGGERQRETAYRFGVNVVMYAMTGNYKTDQVHVPALLERLGN